MKPSDLPPYFRQDHLERDLPDTIESIKSDAEFYADPESGLEDAPIGLKQSARATLKAIAKAEGRT